MAEKIMSGRAHYIKPRDTGNVGGSMRLETTRWAVTGNHKTHEFAYIEEAHARTWGIERENWIEHWVDSRLVNRFRWGHGVVKAYTDSQTWEPKPHRWTVGFIAASLFEHDLPCCGGDFSLLKENVGYCNVRHGHCSRCDAKWEIVDGISFYGPGSPQT